MKSLFSIVAMLVAVMAFGGNAKSTMADDGDPQGGSYMHKFSGNTRFGTNKSGVAGAVVSFTVWENKDIEDHSEKVRNWFNDIGTTETNGDNTAYWSSFTEDGFRDINKKYLHAKPVGLDPAHKYIYMYQVVRHNPDVPLSSFVLPSAYELGPDGLPSVGGVNKIRKEPSVFNCTPWRPRGGKKNFDGADPDRIFGDFKDKRDSGQGRIGWNNIALQMVVEKRKDDTVAKWYMQAPSDDADTPGDETPSHSGTVPINYSGMSHSTRFPEGVVRDVSGGTLTFKFDSLEHSWGTSELGPKNSKHNALSTTSVFYATSNSPPKFAVATLYSADGTVSSKGDVPVPSDGSAN